MQGYWLLKDGTSYWGVGMVGARMIDRKTHKKGKSLKRSLYYAEYWTFSK